jgi:hypothetical protein
MEGIETVIHRILARLAAGRDREAPGSTSLTAVLADCGRTATDAALAGCIRNGSKKSPTHEAPGQLREASGRLTGLPADKTSAITPALEGNARPVCQERSAMVVQPAGNETRVAKMKHGGLDGPEGPTESGRHIDVTHTGRRHGNDSRPLICTDPVGGAGYEVCGCAARVHRRAPRTRASLASNTKPRSSRRCTETISR